MEALAEMYAQWVDAIKEVTEGLDAPKLGKEDSLERRCTSQFKIVLRVLVCF